MLEPCPPMSNAERQRRFQASHPGYDARRKARSRAAERRGATKIMAAMASATAATPEPIATPEPLALPAPVEVNVIPAKRALLMLPAPVEAIVIPGLNAIPTKPAATRERVAA